MAEIGHIKTVRKVDGQIELDIVAGDGPGVTAKMLGLAGFDFYPMAGDPVVFERLGQENHVLSISGSDTNTSSGETIVFSRDAAGEVAAKIHLKQNGEVHVGNAGDFVAMTEATNNKIEALYNAIVAAAVGSADGGAAFKANITAGIEGTFAPMWNASIASRNLKAD